MAVKNYNRMANSVGPDEMAHYKYLHCLHRYLVLVCRAKKINMIQSARKGPGSHILAVKVQVSLHVHTVRSRLLLLAYRISEYFRIKQRRL